MRLSLPLFAWILSSMASADVLIVPDDYPRLEVALDAAAAGDEIVVRTTLDQNVSGLLTVDKAVTIVGDPVCNIDIGAWGLQLDGPGSGELTLVNVSISYFSASSDGREMLFGEGFDAVRLYGCTLVHDNLSPSGFVTNVYPAVDLPDVQELTLVNCDVAGGPAGSDSCVDPTTANNGGPGILAPNASVLLLDSTVTGGRGGFTNGAGNTVEITTAACPADLSTWRGRGGDGVVASELHAWNASVTGGIGTEWRTYAASGICEGGTSVSCGTQASGTAFVVTGTLVDNPCSALTQPAHEIPLGGTWTIDWDPNAPGCLPAGTGCQGTCTALLYLAFAHPIDPVQIGGEWAFLDPGLAFLLTTFPFDVPLQLNLPVPPSLALAGLPVSAQVMLDNGEASGPSSGLLVP